MKQIRNEKKEINFFENLKIPSTMSRAIFAIKCIQLFVAVVTIPPPLPLLKPDYKRAIFKIIETKENKRYGLGVEKTTHDRNDPCSIPT